MQGIVDEERQRDHPPPPSARRVATGLPCLRCCFSSPMSLRIDSSSRLESRGVPFATNVIVFMEVSTKQLDFPLQRDSTNELAGKFSAHLHTPC